MPYVTQKKRELLEVQRPYEAGELNYVVSKHIHDFVRHYGVNYTNLNEVIGVLDCAKAEFYRTVVAPYEDQKRRENGRVSELDGLPMKRKAKRKAK